MKLTENKTRSVTLRMTDKEYDYLNAVSYLAGMTISKYLRTLVDASVNAAKLQEQKGVLKVEDIKAILNDKL